MEFYQIIILALTQGFSEFLPISSSAHLVLVSHFFLSGEPHPLYVDVVLHSATLLAVVLYFAKDIWILIKGFFLSQNYKTRSYSEALVVATIPALIIGFLFYQNIEALRSAPVIALALLVSGVALTVADYAARHNWITLKISLRKKGLGVGLFQSLALIPGISRSGITMAACRSLGFSRKESAKFSFLLSIPLILAAFIFSFVREVQMRGSIFEVVNVELVIGFLLAFCVAYATIHIFIRIITKVGFIPFFAYQVVLGLILLTVAV